MRGPRAGPIAAAVLGLAAVTAGAVPMTAEPPDWPQLDCAVVRQQQQPGQALRLQLRFDNRGSQPAVLPAGPPHLVLYADRALTAALDPTARLDRVSRTVVSVQPGTPRDELFVVAEPSWRALACAAPDPAGATLYFYRFSRTPQQRCRLSGLDLQALVDAAACGSPGAAASGSNR